MLRLHLDPPLVPDQTLDLPPGAARHVQVRRLQPGDDLVLFDGQGGEWTAGCGPWAGSRCRCSC
jgi:16S rRNA (uracil1498-N3)-methyltransferase